MRRLELGALAVALVGLGGAMVATLSAPPRTADADPAVAAATGRLGLGNPVTAVLLDLRVYDTLLEVAVLLVALVALVAARPPRRIREAPPSSPVLRGHARLLIPLLVLTAGYLLHAGADEPGGAFQAGALLGGSAVLWRLSGIPAPSVPAAGARWATSLGLLAFLVLGAAMLLVGLPWLGWPGEGGKLVVLVLEATAALSIGAILAALFAGGLPR